MRIQSNKIELEPEFEPFTVSITFEETRDVLRFLKEVYDIQNIRAEESKFTDDEIPILKHLEKLTIYESGESSWDKRKNKLDTTESDIQHELLRDKVEKELFRRNRK